MVEIYEYKGEGFNAIFKSKGWKIGVLRYCERFATLTGYERHLLSDEVFVLLTGEASLYTEDGKLDMEPLKIYNVPRTEWHHITVSPDATVLVVENDDVSLENTDRRPI